jgi:hypothetical protein
MKSRMTPNSLIHQLVDQAARVGADAIEVDYKDGHEEVVAMRGPIGFGIARFRSAQAEATTLRRDLYRMAKRRSTIAVGGTHYDVRVRIYDSFGEDAFRLEFKQTAAESNNAGATDRGHGAVRKKPKVSRRGRGG